MQLVIAIMIDYTVYTIVVLLVAQQYTATLTEFLFLPFKIFRERFGCDILFPTAIDLKACLVNLPCHQDHVYNV
jgi:hypothetical protein